MAEVRLRLDFHGTKIPKTSADSLRVNISFSYKGPGQILEIETNSGKKGVWGDYDQESPTYRDSKTVYKSDTFKSYTFSRTIPLSFWGDRQIEDCAVEVVIRGEGVYGDAVMWDAYTMNLEGAPPVGEYRLITQASPIAAGRVLRDPDKTRYALGEVVKLTAEPYSGHRFTLWDVDGQFLDYSNPINFMVMAEHTVTAHFKRI